MAGNRMGEQTRERIITAAAEEFIEKGFERAKMEEIAARAGVTKVMLYYHFNSKQNIFNEIVKNVVEEIKTEFRMSIEPADRDDPAFFPSHLNLMLAYYQKRQKVLRLILSEYILRRQENESLTVFNDVFSLILNLAGKKPEDSQEEFLVRVFFFNALPMLMYSCMADSFCQDFNISPEVARQVFIDNFMRTFRAHTSL